MAEPGDSINLIYPNSKTRRGRVGKKIAQTLETTMEQYTIAPLTERRTEEAKKVRKKAREEGKDYSPRRMKELGERKDGLANTVTSEQSKEQLLKVKEPEPTRIRRLTPIECERLQGFPDGWTDGLSDTQRYKTLGNAITVNVVAEILKALYIRK